MLVEFYAVDDLVLLGNLIAATGPLRIELQFDLTLLCRVDHLAIEPDPLDLQIPGIVIGEVLGPGRPKGSFLGRC